MTDRSTGRSPAAASPPAGAPGRPLRIAVVGSGPSGFYATEALLKSGGDVWVHMFERFPTPFGLVRFGVAPDHAKIRNVIKTYTKTAGHKQFRFWGNVMIGRDLTVEELRRHYDAVIFAFGAETDRKLGIPGEDLPRSYTATEFCAWYNGHPDYRNRRFDLTRETAVVIGQGNVAMDVTRMLARSADELRHTDIASHATEALAACGVRDIYCIGRRGPAQAAFTPKEIAELGDIEGCDIVVNRRDLELNPESEAELAMPDRSAAQRNMQTLREFAARKPTGAKKRIILRFFQSPVEIRGEHGVEEVVLETNELVGEPGAQKARGTGRFETLGCGVFFRSVGYKGVPIPGIPFDQGRGVIPNEKGRVEPGMYAVGWIKRGPTGLIGTNKKDSEESVEQLLADAEAGRLTPAAEPDDAAVRALLAERGVRVVTYADWLKIDAAEVERGRAQGKPRDNFTSIDQMLAVLDGQAQTKAKAGST